MARNAAIEAEQHGLKTPRLNRGEWSKKNASRSAQRMIARLGYKWHIPISVMEYHFGSQQLHLPYLSPIEVCKFLMTKHPECFCGGFQLDSEIQCLLATFWKNYRAVHAGHAVFHRPDESASLELTIPLALYGDEGRGRRRGNTALVTLDATFGINTAKHWQEGRLSTSHECCNSDTLKLDDFILPTMKEHSFLSRVPLFLLPCSLYKQHPDLIEFMLGKIAKELKQLFWEGLTIRGKVYTFAILGMKGHAKWLAEVGNLTRFYGKKGNRRLLGVCPECHAGMAGAPYEDVTNNARWISTLWRSRPWDFEPSLEEIPFDAREPERMLRRDLMHVTKLGVYRHHLGSILKVLVRWKIYQQGQPNDVPTLLSRLHGHFRLWCATFSKSPAVRSFTPQLLNWKRWSDYAWLNTKASDCILINQWMQDFLPTLRAEINPEHRVFLDVMLQVCQSISRFTQLVFGHGLLWRRSCCEAALNEGTRILNGYTWLAKAVMPLNANGWAVVPKVHMLKHFMVDMQTFLRDADSDVLFLSPLAFTNEMGEDIIGTICRLSRRADARTMQSMVLTLYLTKACIVHSRWKSRSSVPG